MIELCICNHSNDHVGKQCQHPVKLQHPRGGDDIEQRCGCQSGLRTDVAIARGLEFLVRQMRDLTLVTLEAHSLEIAPDGKVVKKSGIVKLT